MGKTVAYHHGVVGNRSDFSDTVTVIKMPYIGAKSGKSDIKLIVI